MHHHATGRDHRRDALGNFSDEAVRHRHHDHLRVGQGTCRVYKVGGPRTTELLTQWASGGFRSADHLEDVVAGLFPYRGQLPGYLARAYEHHPKLSHGLTLCVGGSACGQRGTTRASSICTRARAS